MASPSKIHPSAALGFGSAVRTAYEHGRPEWETEHVRTILEGMGVLARSNASNGSFPDLPFVEIGSGTGKFTRPLHALLSSRCSSGAAPSLVLIEPAGGLIRLLSRYWGWITVQPSRHRVELIRLTMTAGMGDE